jgi:hypothetical protein
MNYPVSPKVRGNLLQAGALTGIHNFAMKNTFSEKV